MLSIRTQDRMDLVPYDNTIKIDEVSYIVNEKEIENMHKENAKLYKEFPKNGQGMFSKFVLEEEFKNVRLATPEIVYGIKDYCLILKKVNLGTYATQKRALEVLDEIQEFIKNDRNNLLNATLFNEGGTYYEDSSTYEMPKE